MKVEPQHLKASLRRHISKDIAVTSWSRWAICFASMGKSIRSKREKRLRSQRRELAQVNFYDKKDAEVQAKLAAILTEQTVEPREPSAVQMGETVFLIVVFTLLAAQEGCLAQLVEQLFGLFGFILFHVAFVCCWKEHECAIASCMPEQKVKPSFYWASRGNLEPQESCNPYYGGWRSCLNCVCGNGGNLGFCIGNA